MIQGKYAKKEETKNVAIRDIEYGERCAKTVKELADKVKDNPNLAPTKFPFTLLPAGPDGSRNAAALLEEIATRRAMMQKMRAGDEKENPDNPPEYFERLRAAHSVITPVHKQYATGAPLIKSVVAFSKAKDLVRTTDGYALPYKEKGPLLNHVETREKAIPKVGFHAQAWNHGYAPIATTWPRIEEAFVELKKLRQLPATPERIVTFYQKAAEFAWLIGNTQPLIRGSGTANEWLFGVIHELFGYPLPVLKTAFPQFDVLDITFPLSDFIYNICYFFEPSTLPEPVQQKEIPGSILTQMRARYQQK